VLSLLMQRILLFGAGKSATCLIDYLIAESPIYNWEITIADADLKLVQSKAGHSPNVKAMALNVENIEERKILIQNADLIISLLPAPLHFIIARDCIELGKNLLTASYIDEVTKKLQDSIKAKGLFFLYEMGLDPGIDHMSAMQLIDSIKKKSGRIISFKSHTGGLISPESDNNPWHYKISWNPRNIVRAGAAGALYKENSQIKNIPYEKLFEDCKEVFVKNAGRFSYYPNRDSLSYISLYKLEEAKTFIRTTLRHPDFCKNWKYIVKAGLTDDKKNLQTEGLSLKKWSTPILGLIRNDNRSMFDYLGFFDETPTPAAAKTSADILQTLLEQKLKMSAGDKDMIVMLHEIQYEIGKSAQEIRSSLLVKGDDHIRTAMAKTVGLPLGIAAKLILQDKIRLTGLHIPILPEIYEPVMMELEERNIRFNEEVIDFSKA